MPEFRYHDIGTLSIDEALKRLETASGGLSSEEMRLYYQTFPQTTQETSAS